MVDTLVRAIENELLCKAIIVDIFSHYHYLFITAHMPILFVDISTAHVFNAYKLG